jgi:membrane protease YdiL (CAAX protease family)
VATTKLRPVREIALFVVCLFVVWSVRATLLYSIDESIASETLRTVYSTAVKLLLWIVPAFGFARWIRRSPPFPYLGLSVMPSVRQWIGCLIIIGLFLGSIIGFETIVGGKELSLASVPFTITIPGLLLTFVSPLLEEILFRGLFLKELANLLPQWGANLLTSLLFAGIHLPFWLSHEGLTGAVLANTAGVLLFSLVAGWLYLRSSSVWPSYLAHVANNCVAALLVAGSG